MLSPVGGVVFLTSSCRDTSNVCKNKIANCKAPIPTYFTIHGLWPTFRNDTPVPPYDPASNNCNPLPTSPDAIVGKLAPIKDKLDKKWPNLLVHKTNVDFWKIEWQHHGMCSDYPNDPLDYFKDTLNLAQSKRFDPFRALGVQPSDQTPHLLNTLLENVYKNFGAYPQITCIMPQKGVLLLKEIHFCLKRTKKRPPSVVQNCSTHVGDRCTNPLTDYVWLRATPTIFSPHNVTSDLLAST
ncbi:ribonuclease S-7-like [Gossypium australe]|uniref:Ribonuclease S-7-like n=1 Tax=Gossypium australe TaxID=47621 RepID=A0A5B6WAN7_9ROSI|nr:ribonuclease S-7-like [Gossypium australe]